jgi:hypothetical protein
LANADPSRSQDVALLAIGIEEKGQPRIAVGIVMNRGYFGRDAMFVATEVDQTI